MTAMNDTGPRMHADTLAFPVGTYKLLAVAIGIIGVLGFCNNLLVLAVYYTFKRLQTPINLLLLNISVSDLLVSVFGNSFTLVSCLERGWVWDSTTCVLDGFSNGLLGIVSIMTLCTLAYERYIRVVHAKVIDFPWAWRAIIHIWLYSLAWTSAPLLGWNRYTLEIHQLSCSLDWASKDPNDATFIFFFLLASFILPVGIMAYCYGNILYTLHMLCPIEDLQTVQTIKVLRFEKKLAAMFLLMICCYLMCWTPSAVVSMLVAFSRQHVISPTVAIISSFFAKFSTAYNPIIYGFMSRKFRRCMLQLLCSRLLGLQCGIRHHALTCTSHPVRPIVMSSRKDRPKKRVTFNSSSIVFIIASDDTDPLNSSYKCQHRQMRFKSDPFDGARSTQKVIKLQSFSNSRHLGLSLKHN